MMHSKVRISTNSVALQEFDGGSAGPRPPKVSWALIGTGCSHPLLAVPGPPPRGGWLMVRGRLGSIALAL